MAETIRPSSHDEPLFTLNNDGRSHPLMNTVSVVILIVGLVAFGFGLAIVNTTRPGPGLAVPAGALGLTALLAGLYAQMMSETRGERILIVTGIICGFVGLALGLAHGAFG